MLQEWALQHLPSINSCLFQKNVNKANHIEISPSIPKGLAIWIQLNLFLRPNLYSDNYLFHIHWYDRTSATSRWSKSLVLVLVGMPSSLEKSIVTRSRDMMVLDAGEDSWSCCGRTILGWRLWSNICDSLINWSSYLIVNLKLSCENHDFYWLQEYYSDKRYIYIHILLLQLPLSCLNCMKFC